MILSSINRKDTDGADASPRHLYRAFVDRPEADSAACEGQVECVATGERVHVRKQEEVIHFIETRIGLPSGVEAEAGKQTDQ